MQLAAVGRLHPLSFDREWIQCKLKWTGASELHIARHGVRPDGVEEVLAGPPVMPVHL